MVLWEKEAHRLIFTENMKFDYSIIIEISTLQIAFLTVWLQGSIT